MKRFWGFDAFRFRQKEIIDAVLENKDVFALLPTGGGKSICYQVPALMRDGVCIVISPLIALMKDQVKDLKAKGIKAIALTSGLKKQELDSLLDNCIYGGYKFLYLSPERLQQDLVQSRIRQMNVSLIAVDEAHCISQWGHDFRPAYRNISVIKEYHPNVNTIALTATARPEVIADILDELQMNSTALIRASFQRDNLAYQVFRETDKYYRLKRLLSELRGSAIIYMRNRKSTVKIHRFLEESGISSTYYHGGMSAEEKDKSFTDWKSNLKSVIVATNAFGMGIDKPDVRLVIHLDIPESIESYFQEAGRAGRDGEYSESVLLINDGDIQRLKKQFLGVLPDSDFVKRIYKNLSNYFQIAYGEGQETIHDLNFNAFCSQYKLNPILAYNALLVMDRNSIIKLSHQFENKCELQIIAPKQDLFNYIEKRTEEGMILKIILRTYGGILDYKTAVNTHRIAQKMNQEESRIISLLENISRDGIIDLNLGHTDASISYVVPREDDLAINRISGIIKQQNSLKKKQVKAVINYLNEKDICRSRQLLAYFGEDKGSNCGICSVCTEGIDIKHPSETRIEIEAIKNLLQSKSLGSRDIAEKTQLAEERIKILIRIMLEKDVVELTKSNTYTLKQ